MATKMTTPRNVTVEAHNGITYKIDTVPRPVHMVGQGDCAIRAMHLALGMDYEFLLEYVEHAQGRKVTRRKGTDIPVLEDILKGEGWTYHTERRRLGSNSAVNRLPRRAILDFKGHVVYIEDGVIYDNFMTHYNKQCRQTLGWWLPPSAGEQA